MSHEFADGVKLIYWDGTGVCLFAKRLEDGKFRWPNVHDGVMRLSAAELTALLEGSRVATTRSFDPDAALIRLRRAASSSAT